MAKLTLLQMVQKILSAMDSDDVNSIIDTEEAVQITDVIEDSYFHLLSQQDWPHLKKTCTLTSVSNTSRPTELKLPDDVAMIERFKYDITKAADTNKTITDMKYCEPTDFIDMMFTRNTSDAATDVVFTESGTPLFIFNDRAPTFWTSFDDETITLDAYDQDEETTLNGSKALVFCVTLPVFDKFTDSFVPDLPEEHFPTLLSMSRRAAMLYHKQTDSAVDAKRELQGIHRMRQHGWRTNSGKKKARFGRSRRGEPRFRID